MWFVRKTSDSNTFIRPSNNLLKRIQKQDSKHRFQISRLCKIFDSYFNVFKVFWEQIPLSVFFDCLDLGLQKCIFLCFTICFWFAYLFACVFVMMLLLRLCFLSTYMHIFYISTVDIFYCQLIRFSIC